MHSALVGHDIDSLYLSASLILVNLPFMLSFFSSVFAYSLFQPPGVFGPASLCVWSFLSWRQSASLLPTSVCPENQTQERCCLMIRTERARSVVVFILFLLFYRSLGASLSVCSSDLTA